LNKWFLLWAILSINGEVYKSGVEPVASLEDCKLEGYVVPGVFAWGKTETGLPVTPNLRDAFKVTTCVKLTAADPLPYAWAGQAFANPYPLPPDMMDRIKRSQDIAEETRKRGEASWKEFMREMDQQVRDAEAKERRRGRPY
jgi:hypothetical protein